MLERLIASIGPFTISTIVVKLTATCLTTAKALYDLRQRYNDSPLSIVTISSETTILSACLSHLQTIICRKQDFVQELDSRPELAHTLDGALTGCMVLFSCLDEEIRKITASSSHTGALSWKGKAKAVWNHERLRDLLDALRGQQIAINLLIQLVQLDSLGEIKQLLAENRPVLAESIQRTQSLKQSHPDIDFPASIYSVADHRSVDSNAPSIAGASDFEFDFDDFIVNSKVYRRVLASARGKAQETDQGVIEGDLIDLSESQTIIAVPKDETTRDLECLVVSHDEQDSDISPKSHTYHAVADLNQLQTFAGQDSPERENIPALDTPLPRHSSPVNVPGLVNSNVVRGGNRDIREIFREKSENPTKEVRFGKYLLGEILYAGKRSKVRLAWKVEGGVQVTIKIVKPKPQNPHHPRKIDQEASILRQLDHPNIVRFHEIIETETRVGIVLDYASGGDLFGYINNHLYLTNSTARKFFAQLISGVGFLHQKGIVHRQLNLNSILLDRNHNIIIGGFTSARTFISKDEQGKGIELNLSNWRFVKHLELDIAEEVRGGDLMHTRCGKLMYAAPELVLNPSVYAARKIDIWSCGIILYVMLSGHLPFRDDPQADHLADPDNWTLLLLYKYISSATLTFPKKVNQHARDLLRRVIVVDPTERADIAEVAQHTWLKDYDFMLGWIYGQSGGAIESVSKPNDSETLLAATNPA